MDRSRQAGALGSHVDRPEPVAQHIASPQDDEILRLGTELNQTYMAYGADHRKADASSLKMNPKVALERAQLKSKKGYKNTNWDVVDAVDSDAQILDRPATTSFLLRCGA